MTEQTEQQRVKVSTSGLTIEVDLAEMINAMDPSGRYVGYDPENDETRYEPGSLGSLLVDAASDKIVRVMHKDVRTAITDAVNAQVREEVAGIVRDTLVNGVVQRTNEFGGKVAEPIPLIDLIRESAADVLNKPIGDSYSRNRQTVLKKILADEVSSAFRKEVKDAVDQARAATLAAVKENAAQVLTETIARATKGI
jgi:phage baseplate assembly protein W